MKMAKKFLAVALAGVLALSVLTGCGKSVKSKDIADALTKMGVKVEQDDGVDKAAKETLAAIEAISSLLIPTPLLARTTRSLWTMLLTIPLARSSG